MKITFNELIKKSIKHNKLFFILIIIEIIVLIIFKCIFHSKQSDPIIYIIINLSIFMFLGCNIELLTLKKLKKEKSLQLELQKKIIYYPDGCILTDHYLIIHFKKKTTFKYSDIALVYMQSEITRFGVYKYLYIILKTGKKYSVCINRKNLCVEDDFEYDDVFKSFISKNKNILIGKTKENKKILLDKYNIKI